MSTTVALLRGAPARTSPARPAYELRANQARGLGLVLAVWELPTPATPRLSAPECVGTLRGRALEILEARIFRRLRSTGIRLSALRAGEEQRAELDEDAALILALLFRTLAPMRSLDRIRQVADGIERMSREEAGYWLGMAVHRRNPRRVLAALRMLLAST